MKTTWQISRKTATGLWGPWFNIDREDLARHAETETIMQLIDFAGDDGLEFTPGIKARMVEVEQ